MHQRATQDSHLRRRSCAWKASTKSRIASSVLHLLPSNQHAQPREQHRTSCQIVRKMAAWHDEVARSRCFLTFPCKPDSNYSMPRFDFVFSIETLFLSGLSPPIEFPLGLEMHSFRKGNRPDRIDSPPLRTGVAAASPSSIRHVLRRTCCCSVDLPSTVCCSWRCWTRHCHLLRERRWEKRT